MLYYIMLDLAQRNWRRGQGQQKWVQPDWRSGQPRQNSLLDFPWLHGNETRRHSLGAGFVIIDTLIVCRAGVLIRTGASRNRGTSFMVCAFSPWQTVFNVLCTIAISLCSMLVYAEPFRICQGYPLSESFARENPETATLCSHGRRRSFHEI